MDEPTATRRTYEHRIREAVCATGNPYLFPNLSIPRSTALTWIRRGSRDVVELAAGEDGIADLRSRIAKLDPRVAVLHAVVRLLLLVLRLSELRLDWTRVPEGGRKEAAVLLSTATRDSLLATAPRLPWSSGHASMTLIALQECFARRCVPDTQEESRGRHVRRLFPSSIRVRPA